MAPAVIDWGHQIWGVMSMASVGTHIKRLRAARGLTQEALAERLFVTRQAVSAWETGKALPDVETLERIAAALDADVTEVIYGVPQAPDLRRVRRRWALIGSSFVIIIALFVIILHGNGMLGTWTGGLQYQLGYPVYRASYEDAAGAYSVELDLWDLDSNVGKVLYEDSTGCRITVWKVDEMRDGIYRVWFRSHGVCRRNGSQLVSGTVPYQTGSASWTDKGLPWAAASAGGLERDCPVAGMSGLNWKDGNEFGFYLTSGNGPSDRFFSAADIDRQDGKITVTVSGLTRLSTERMWYWYFY